MDFLSIFGIILGISAIVGGNLIEGGTLASLSNAPAFLIVFGGTLGATLLQFPPHVFFRSLQMVWWIVRPVKIDLGPEIEKVVDWASLARKEGLLGLEGVIEYEKNSFARKGLQLLIDGSEPEVIRDCLEVELNFKEQMDLQASRVFGAMGGYAPTIGIIGAVIGLIHVMSNLTDPALLGAGIATAFVATIYGVGMANLIFLPISNKLKMYVYELSQEREMFIDGITAIAEGENPRNIEMKLSGYLHKK